jgi:hypothetical protein
MRKYIIIIFLHFCLLIQGQDILINSFSFAADTSTLYSEYKTIFDAMDVKPQWDTALYQDDMVYSLDSAGFWDRIKLLYMPVAASSLADSYHNWADVNNTSDYTAAIGDAPVFDRVVGWDGNGSSDYLTTGWIPGSDSSLVNHAAGVGNNDITIAAWCTATTKGNTNPMGVVEISFTGLSFINYTGSDTFYAYLNSDNYSSFGDNVTGSGFTMATRRGPTDVEGYRNGSPTGTVDTDQSVRLPIDRAMYLLANNDRGSAAAFHPDPVAIILVMDAVTDAEALAIYNIFNLYMNRTR